MLQDGSSEPIAFEVSDAETDAVSAAGNGELVESERYCRVAGISIGGNGRERTLLLTPQPADPAPRRLPFPRPIRKVSAPTATLSLTVTTREESFRNFAVTTIGASSDSQPAEVAGHAWIDTGNE